MHARDSANQAADSQEEPLSPEQIAEAQAADEVCYERSLAAASNLIAAKLSGRFVILDDIDEGTIFPDGTVDISGSVLDERGDFYAFWVDWDPDAGRPTLGIWRREDVTSHDRRSVEYRRARALVGLGADGHEPPAKAGGL
jgi:hypothetical protein